MIATDLADVIDWLPVDKAATVVSDIVQYELNNRSDPILRVFNLTHPVPVPFSVLVPLLQEWCGEDAKLVSMKEWVRVLEQKDVSAPEVLAMYPALRMWNLFRMLATRGPSHRYCMEGVKSISGTMKSMARVDPETACAWLRQL